MPQFESVKSEILEKICQSSPKQRRKLIDKLIGVDPKAKKKTERKKRLDFDRSGKWSEDLIVEVLKGVLADHGKLTIPLLERLRREDPKKYPSPSTVRYKFGSWQKAKKAAGACRLYENLFGDIEEDSNYFFSLYHQLKVTTRDMYYEARKKYPQIIPPYRRLLEIFGSFTRFRQVAQLTCPRGQLNRLVVLVESLNGRWPRRSLCKENGIDIVYLDNKMGGRRELKEFVRDLRSAIKIKDFEIEK